MAGPRPNLLSQLRSYQESCLQSSDNISSGDALDVAPQSDPKSATMKLNFRQSIPSFLTTQDKTKASVTPPRARNDDYSSSPSPRALRLSQKEQMLRTQVKQRLQKRERANSHMKETVPDPFNCNLHIVKPTYSGLSSVKTKER